MQQGIGVRYNSSQLAQGGRNYSAWWWLPFKGQGGTCRKLLKQHAILV
nr:MAG TPA: Protein prenyltransferase alpha subunit repeat [Caudoviricetes sp.]